MRQILIDCLTLLFLCTFTALIGIIGYEWWDGIKERDQIKSCVAAGGDFLTCKHRLTGR